MANDEQDVFDIINNVIDVVPEQIETLHAAVDHYGKDAQVMQMIEEAAELIVAINHYKRKPTTENYQAMIDEMADVSIMIDQMAIMFSGVDLIKSRTKKLTRLADRIDQEKHLQ